MDAAQLLAELPALGQPSTARVLRTHGARDPVWGVRIGDMKPLIRGIQSDPALARALFESGVYDAMYLAALVVKGHDLEAATLDGWVRQNYGGAISESTLPWLTAEHPEGPALALTWIDDPHEFTAVAGWATLGGLASLKADSDLDLGLYRRLLDRVGADLPQAPNRVRYVMNSFLIQVAVYVEALRPQALAVAEALGPVKVDQGGTACAVPDVRAYVEKCLARGPVKKKKTLKC